jgi:aspartate/methionine/tyrosine aminotransferase
MIELNERVATLKPSATVEMTELVRAERAAGKNILSLSSGDPSIPTDPRIIAAMHKAALDGDTKYAPSQGKLKLREAICAREKKRSGAIYDPADVIVTPGGKFAIFVALMSFIGKGDEVLVMEPGWVSYNPIVSICGGTAVNVPALDTVDADLLQKHVTARTAAIIVNSPVNPTGRVLEQDEIDALVAFAAKNDLWIIFDQVYSDLLHEGEFPYPQSTRDGFERTIVVDSFSKSYGMTGWRLGYLAMKPGYAKKMLRLIQHSIYSVPGFIQDAGLEALRLHDELVPGYAKAFRRRQLMVAEALNAVPGMRCGLPRAGFYLFPSVDADDKAVASYWLQELQISSLPGSAFGPAGKGHLRLSVTSSDEELKEILGRIKRGGIGAGHR